MSRTDDASGTPSAPSGAGRYRGRDGETGTARTAGTGAASSTGSAGRSGSTTTRRRPLPDQPLRARWDPTDDNGRQRSDRDAAAPRKKQSALGRFVTTYGWRAYAIPVLVVLTIVLLVYTVRDGGTENTGAPITPSPSSRNVGVTKETRPIGAPTGDIQAAQLTEAALPGGGGFTTAGRKTYHVVAGTTPRVGGGGQVYTYTVEAENGLVPSEYGGDQAFAKMVDATLANRKSWIGDGKVSFQRIDRGEPNLRISLTSTDTTRELCGYQIRLETSCFYPPDERVILNEARWVRGALSYQGDDVSYRQYLVNHEVGHGIGYEHHEPCPANGAPAPIMMQQSFGVSNSQIMALDPDVRANPSLVCKPNPWPFPDRTSSS